MRYRRPSLCSAFTLIELLTVISVISLLIAILLPALTSARQSAQSIRCHANLRQQAVAFHAYAIDYNGYAPMLPSGASASSEWMVSMAPYLGAAGDVGSNQNLATWAPKHIGILQCPSTFGMIDIWGETSYAVNAFFTLQQDYGGAEQTANAWWQSQYLEGAVKLTDSRIEGNSTSFILSAESIAPNQIIPSWNAVRLYDFLHNETRNFAFVDGHVETSGPSVTDYVLAVRNSGTLLEGRNNHNGGGEP